LKIESNKTIFWYYVWHIFDNDPQMMTLWGTSPHWRRGRRQRAGKR